MNGKRQRDVILSHLRRAGKRGVTLQHLRDEYKIATPNARISELKQQGINIQKRFQEVVHDGWRTREMVYTLGRPVRASAG